jgi:hypothetical protein
MLLSMLAPALFSSLVVHALALLYFFAVPVAARRLANNTCPHLRASASSSQPMTEHGMTNSHTYHIAVALGVTSLICSARTLRRAACVSLSNSQAKVMLVRTKPQCRSHNCRGVLLRAALTHTEAALPRICRARVEQPDEFNASPCECVRYFQWPCTLEVST